MAWVSPTGHSDPSELWYDESFAYDENLGTAAYGYYSSNEIWFTHAALTCSKVRFNVNYAGSLTWQVRVYYDGAYHTVYSGEPAKNTWVEAEIGSEESVTEMNLSTPGIDATVYINEVEFWEVEAPPAVKTLVQAALISIPPLIVLPTLAQIIKVTGG